MLRKLYLLSSTACFAPPERARGAAAASDDDHLDVLDGEDEDVTGDEDEGDDTEGGEDVGADAGDEDAGDGDAEGAERAALGDGEGDDPEDAEAGRSRGRRQDAGQPRRQGRASEVIRTLKAKVREKDEAQTTLQRRLDDLERKFSAPPVQPQKVLSAREEADLLATMTVEERIDYKQNKLLDNITQQNNQLARNVTDTSDRQQFNAKLSEVPRLKKYIPDVEAKYNEIIRNGGYVPRVAVLTYLLGEKALQRLASGDVRPGAQQRMRKQRVAPSNNRGDAAPQRSGSRTKSLEQRLDGVPI